MPATDGYHGFSQSPWSAIGDWLAPPDADPFHPTPRSGCGAASLRGTVSLPAEPTPDGLPACLGFISRPTPRLRQVIERQEASLPPSDFAELLASVRSLFEKFTARLLSAPAGLERGRVLHALTEQTMSVAAQIPVSCCKGCSGCCHYEIEITGDEAAILAAVVRGGYPADMERLRTQAGRERKAAEWLDVLRPDNRCVFLGIDGACQIYEHRPSACRRHLVTSPAEACTQPGQPVAPVEILTTEILLSAALSAEGTRFASLSKMLLAALQA